jgi:SAM-dependent methyltransferase
MSERRAIEAFGAEWTAFDYGAGMDEELTDVFADYFRIFPWESLPPGATGFDLGCGSGRWARLVAPRVGHLHCVDASAAAVEVARRNLAGTPNCGVSLGRAGELPFEDASMDFGYALGVIHHLDDPPGGLADAVAKLRPGAPFLAYVYYALDERPLAFRLAWHATDLMRRVVSRLPLRARRIVSEPLAFGLYWPLARLARLLERLGADVADIPLAQYRHRSLYVMRNDALDRFGTPLERRYTRAQAIELMSGSGLERVTVSPDPPFWCVLGYAPRA